MPSGFKENAEDLNTGDSVQVDVNAVRRRVDAFTGSDHYRFTIDGIEYDAHWAHDTRRLLDENARLNAELDRLRPQACGNCGKTVVDRRDTHTSERYRACISCGWRPDAAPEMPRPPAEEALTEYLCPNCYRWALWTDGVVDGDDGGAEEFWCQTCGSQTPIESMDSRPQEPVSGPETAGTGSGRGTGVTEAPGTAQAREEWGIRRRDGRVLSFEDRDDAEAFADGWHGGERTVVHRFIGPWEPAPSLPVPSTEEQL